MRVQGGPPRVTRYVRVEARNDGTHDEGDYTELRSLKLFSVSGPGVRTAVKTTA
jgi:hypothetical protein